ncbi:MAG: glycosyltransferase family 2 protein [Collinsella sp.]|nr:glycosyltransferase family 2 protein [Collinsella sp.]
MAPRVSVIIPLHNAERHIGACLDSVQGQTERDLEIICVDDLSTDGSVPLIEARAAADGRIRLIRSDRNGGAGHARNLGIEAANGAYLAFLDADDFFEPTFMEEAAEKLDRTGADLVVTKSTTYEVGSGEDYETGWTFVAENIPAAEPFSYRDMPERIFNTFANVPWNKVFRASFVRGNGLGFQEILRTNDLLFVCKALVLARGIVTIDRPFTHYRVGTLTNSQATNDREPLGFFKAFKALHEFLEERGLLPEVERSFVNHALDGFAANMASQRAFSGYQAIFEARHEYDAAFGITGHEPDYYYDSAQITRFEEALSTDFERFLFTSLHNTRVERNAAWARGRVIERQMWENYEKLGAAERRIADLERELAAARAACEEGCARVRELTSALDARDGELDALKGSTSFRLGRAITSPGRGLRDLLK